MSTGLLPESAAAREFREPTGRSAAAIVVGYAATLGVPLAAAVTLITGWTLVSASGWLAGAVFVAAWWVVAVTWLRFRGWTTVVAHLVTWGAPAALLAPLTVLGWLPADGLVLWAPLTGVLVTSLAMTARQD